MADKLTEVEKFGIEHIPEDQRHGSPGRVFTLWFAANLTIADYVIGVLCVLAFHLTVTQSIPVLVLGNLLGGLMLGLSAAMGPKLGYPQMFASRSVFGRRGNYVFGAANWISTAGWFTVNTILGVEAIEAIAPGVGFIPAAVALVGVQVMIAIYGHDFIHLFEKVMSVVLGALFLGVLLVSIPRLGEALSFMPAGSSQFPTLGAIGVVLAVSFSYIMSWSPYASDYSRYLPVDSSTKKVALYAFAGGAIASFGIEMIGAIVGSLTQSFDYFGSLRVLAGSFGPVAVMAIILGAMAANALNIYTNSLSTLVLDIRTRRWVAVVVGGLVGLALAVAGGENFESFFENFLLTLDYWITPWLAIVLVDFYLLKRTTPESCANARSWEPGTLAIYAASVLVSVPFMVPPTPVGGPVGYLSGAFGGADFSYFISFIVAGSAYLVYRKRRL
ncbi:MAG TPA: cytosine permease [Conexivisphaerales archaeon]|nr:cytosine permease [Conexivisphaerales archaeon]